MKKFTGKGCFRQTHQKVKCLSVLVILFLLVSFQTACTRVENEASPGPAITSTSETAEASATAAPEASPSVEATPSATNSSAEASWPIPRGKLTPDGVRYGYADAGGNFVIDPVYESAMPFSTTGKAVVSDTKGNRAVISLDGRQIIPMRLFNMNILPNGFIMARTNVLDPFDNIETTAVFDKDGKLLFQHPGYLNDFSDGLALSYEKERYGYIDESGSLALPLKEEQLGPFEDGLAIVAETYAHASYYIDKTGDNVTATVSSNLAAYYDEDAKLFGYKKMDGTALTEAIFISAQPFKDGTAIVEYNPDSEYNGLFGLIDTKGKFLIPAKSCGIKRLRNGLFSVGEILKSSEGMPYEYGNFAILALYDASGKALTDFSMTSVNSVNTDLAVLCDGKHIWFVGKDGKRRDDMPMVAGLGTLQVENGFLTGRVNGFDVVLDLDGKSLAVLRHCIEMDNGLVLTDEKITGDRFADLSYPVLSGMKDAAVQGRLNQEIVNAIGSTFTTEPEVDEDTGVTFIETLDGDWTAWSVGDVLCVEQSAYSYYLGAAHGMPFMQTLHLDLKSGDVFTLSNLFAADKQNDAMVILSKSVTETMVRDMEEIGYFEDSVTVDKNQAFRLTKEGLVLYYAPIEIASYAAGFREFTISWETLDAVLDKEGVLYRAMNR